MAVVAGAGEVLVYGGDTVAHAGTGDDAGEHLDHQRNSEALGAAKGQERPFAHLGGISDGISSCIDGGPFGQRYPLVDMVAHRGTRERTRGHVDQQVHTVPAGRAEGEGIGAKHRPEAAIGHNLRNGVAHGEPDHRSRGSHVHVIRAGAKEIAVAHPHDADASIAR